ncbi:hypothetical protein Tco_1012569, partial [Tanacetum coccineum]
LIYVNSTVSKKVKVEKIVPAFKAWSSNLLLKRQQEELDLKGFGLLPIVKGLEFIEPKKVNKKKKLKSITEDEDETPEKVEQIEDFHYKTFEDKEMKEILKDNLLKGRNLMEDIDNKLDIDLAVNSDDEELKNIIEKRNEFFVTLYKDVNKNVKEDDEDKDRDLEKDDDDKEKNVDDDDNDVPDRDNDDKDDDETDGDNDDKNDDDKDENNDKNDDDDDETNGDNDDETDGDNDDKDEDDDDENDDNDENDENIRNEKEKKGGSKNVEDDNVEEGINDVEQKDKNVEEEKEKKKVPDDMVWDKTKAIMESEKIRDPSLVIHQMIEDMTKLPLISGALKGDAHDVPPVDARLSFNKLKLKLKQNSVGTIHVKNIDDVSCAVEKGSVNAVEVPTQKVVNAAKDKTVQFTKRKCLKR